MRYCEGQSGSPCGVPAVAPRAREIPLCLNTDQLDAAQRTAALCQSRPNALQQISTGRSKHFEVVG